MSSDSYVGRLLTAFAEAFQPLEDSLIAGETVSAFLADFGWALDPHSDVSVVASALGRVPSELTALSQAVTTLETAVAGDDVQGIAKAVDSLAGAIKSLANEIHALSSITANAAWPAPLNTQDFWTVFPEDLLEYLLYRYLEDHVPKLFVALRLLGVLTEDYRVPIEAGRVPYLWRGLRWDRLISAISDPKGVWPDVYGWGAAFEPRRLFDDLTALCLAFGLTAGTRQPTQAILDAYYDAGTPNRAHVYELSLPVLWTVSQAGPTMEAVTVEIAALPIPAVGNRDAAPFGVALYPRVTGDAGATFQLTQDVSITLAGSFVSDALIRAEIRPTGANVFVDPTLSGEIDAALKIDGQRTPPWVLCGDPAGTRVEIAHAHTALKAQGNVPDIEFIIELAADSAALVVDFSEGDGFIGTLLGGSPKRLPLNVGLAWSSKTGLRFNGQVGFAATIAVNQTIADVLSVDTVDVAIRAGGSPASAQLLAAVSGGFSIGPVTAHIQGVGLTLNVTPVAHGAPSGNLGLADLSFGFKPPDGLGLAISAPGVTGVGLLECDPAKGEYLGVVSLNLASVSVAGVGLLTTRMPDGPGFSLVVLASAEFPPVQLGFGIALRGLGGLVGLHRTMNVPALQQLARSGGLDSVMFPADLMHNAPRVAADLGSYFPAAEGQYVFGPAARLEWGPTGFLAAEVAVLIELPAPLRVALVGLVHLTLPQASAPIADITLDVLGVLDLSAKTLSIDAGLRDSRIAGFTLSGQAALRAGWGQDPTFVLAVGGFNPHFAAPPGFPALQRVALSLGGDNPRFRLSTYFAITSNTLQLGARAELYASAGPAAVSASLSFDALVQYHPFQLELDLTISAAILLNGSPLLSLGLELHVTGPSPWHVSGHAHFSILFFSFTVPINLTVGESAPTLTTPPAVDVIGQLTGQLSDLHNWSTSPPSGAGLAVLRAGLVLDVSAVHPLGSLTVRQHVVPLGQSIDRLGADPLPARYEFDLGQATVCGLPVSSSAVTDFFAPAQFNTLSDAERLSAPSFERLQAGVTIGTASLSVADDGSVEHVAFTVDSSRLWTTLLLDVSPTASPASSGSASSQVAPVTGSIAGLAAVAGVAATARGLTSLIDATSAPAEDLLAAQLGGAAASVNGVLSRGRARYVPSTTSGLSLAEPTYAVANPTTTILQPLEDVDQNKLVRVPSHMAASRQLSATILAPPSALVVYNSELTAKG